MLFFFLFFYLDVLIWHVHAFPKQQVTYKFIFKNYKITEMYNYLNNSIY